MEYLDSLNQSQRDAVLATDGPTLVIAGAGSGKTRVLTMRIAHLLENGVKPYKILSLTFTNKAAREMKERIATIVGDQSASQLWMGTFHSVFARILRAEAEHLGFTSSFTIYDTTDSKSLLRSIIKEMKLDDKEYKTSSVLSAISSAKNDLITPAAYGQNPSLLARDKSARRMATAEIYVRYVRECRKANALDFDDLLLYTNILFRDHPDVLAKYQERFDYVLVDEYQDTNFSQYLIVKKLVERHRNICVVGDDAQSIYSFRGAKIENILNFRNDYSDYKLFKLEQNYRSTQNIVNIANSIISHNEGQIKKNVYSENDEGSKVRVIKACSDFEEAVIVSNDIAQLRSVCGYTYKDFAILYRTNAQSRAFEDELRKKGIPYRIFGGQAFYQRKEVKDVLAYFRMGVNPNDNEALKRIINYPVRGIGSTTVDKLQQYASASGVSIWQLLISPSIMQVGFNGGTMSKLNKFVTLCGSIATQSRQLGAYEFAAEVVSLSGIMKELSESRNQVQEERDRLDNVNELLNGIKDFADARIEAGQPASIVEYLEEVSLITDMDNDKNEDVDHITLMTIHSSKGLEFKNVYIVGVEEDMFPGQASASDPRAVEEERRLFYVAVTRAEENAMISYTRSRFQYGKRITCRPSRFIAELDERYIEVQDEDLAPTSRSSFNYRNERQSEPRPFWQSATPKTKPSFDIQNTRAAAPQRRLAPIDRTKSSSQSTFQFKSASQPTIDGFTVGRSVLHERFGEGVITGIDGNASDTKLTIDFKHAGIKHLLVKFARLKLL